MKNLFKNLTIITIPTFLILFLLLELVVRIFFDHVDLLQLTGKKDVVNPMSEWAEIDAFAAYTARPEASIPGKTINSSGFMSTPEIDKIKNINTLRVVFLGGSSTAGTGVNLPDTATWPWKTIEKLRNDSGIKIDFINGALGGYSTFESYGRLWSRLRFYNPDVIVVYHGWNDMYYFVDQFSEDPLLWRVKRSRFGDDWGVYKPLKYETIIPKKIDDYIHWSQILVRIRRIFAENSVYGELRNFKSDSLSSSFNPKGVSIFKENLKLIREFSNTFNCKLFICKQATLIVPDLADTLRSKVGYEAHGFDHDSHVEAFDSIYMAIDQLFDPNQIIDLTGLSGNPSLFFDHIHPTNKGTSEISSIISDALKVSLEANNNDTK